jgi:hypothetical protein
MAESYQVPQSGDDFLKTLVAALLTQEVEGVTMCRLPYCQAVIGASVQEIVNHYWTHHKAEIGGVAFAGSALLYGAGRTTKPRRRRR